MTLRDLLTDDKKLEMYLWRFNPYRRLLITRELARLRRDLGPEWE